MTDLDAPPIQLNVTAARSLVAAPGHASLVGTGRTGKRLFIRVPALTGEPSLDQDGNEVAGDPISLAQALADGSSRWAFVQYGAGIDPVVKSFNVWDDTRKKWFTPAYYRDANPTDSMYFRVTGGVWDNSSLLNPTYTENNTLTFRVPANWIRMFFLRERNDPTWRIVNLSEGVPAYSPALGGLRHLLDFTNFTPTGGFVITNVAQTLPAAPVSTVLGFADGLPACTMTLSKGNTGGVESTNVRATSVLLDLAAIRRHLEAEFNLNNFYRGNYHPLTLQRLKRIIIGGKFTMSATASTGDANFAITGPPDWFSSALGTINMFPGGAGISIPEVAYTPRYPTITAPSGPLVTSQLGLPNQSITASAAAGSGLGHTYSMTIEDPSEDNYTFTAGVSGVGSTMSMTQPHRNPSTGVWETALWPAFLSATVTFTIATITVHYADDGHDSPVDTHWESFGLGPYHGDTPG